MISDNEKKEFILSHLKGYQKWLSHEELSFIYGLLGSDPKEDSEIVSSIKEIVETLPAERLDKVYNYIKERDMRV